MHHLSIYVDMSSYFMQALAMKRILKPGRPRTSPLTRAEQLRVAKRGQRRREREAGLAPVELRLAASSAQKLRLAAATPGFDSALDRFLEELVLEIDAWPTLRDLAWNRADRFMAAEDALSLYERNWRFVDVDLLDPREKSLIGRLKDRFGAGVINA